MEEPMETALTSEQLDLPTVRSQIEELRSTLRRLNDVHELSPSDSEKLIKDCVLHLESVANETLSQYLDTVSSGEEDVDQYLDHLKDELKKVEEENAKISHEIEAITRSYEEDCNCLEGDLEGLSYSLNFLESQGLEKANAGTNHDCSTYGAYEMDLRNPDGYCKFESLKLTYQIEKIKRTLKSLQDLDCTFKRSEASEKFEDILTGIKVIEFEGNCIRLSLKTYIPTLESFVCQQKIEDVSEPSEVDHELLVEVVDGTMELRNVQIFPNDVCIGKLVEAAKSYRNSILPLSTVEKGSPLEWFVSKVQERIVLCTLRRYIVKASNNSRHSFEYLDKDELIVAHMVGGVDAFMMVSHGWPILNTALKLIFLKTTDHQSKEISLSFLCKVQEAANNLDSHIRQNISSFLDATEEILFQQMRIELHFNDTSKK